MVLMIPSRLPLLQSHGPLVRSAPTGVPRPSDPWHPAQVPFATSPWKIRSPKATWSLVTPGCGVSAAVWRPASGCTPSGGSSALFDEAPEVFGAGAAATLAASGDPWYVTRQMRPCSSSEIYSEPSGPAANPDGRCAARPGSFTAPAKPSANTTKLP